MPLASTAVGVVEPARAGMASGINSTLRQVGIATGVAALGAIFSHHASEAARGPARLEGLVDGLNAILLVGAVLALIAAVTSLILIRRKDFVRRRAAQRVQLYAAAHERRRSGATGGSPGVLPLRDLLRELDVRTSSPARPGSTARCAGSTAPSSRTRRRGSRAASCCSPPGLQLGDDAQQREYVARLAEHGLSGLGFGVGFSHERAPEALRAAAAEHGFPLFEVPYELPFIAITEKAFTQLVNEQYAVLRRALSAHERLERIVLSERGLDGVAGELAALIGGAALIFDGRGELLAAAAARSRTRRSRRCRRSCASAARAAARRGFVPAALAAGALALPGRARAGSAGRGEARCPRRG